MTERLPDVVLTDISMPGEDGYSLLHRVRTAAARAGRAVPTASISAGATPGERRRALDAGFARHLAKPVRPDELAETVLQLTRKH